VLDFRQNDVCVYVSVGVCNKKLRRYEDALDSFLKLHNILRNSAQVMYQLADLYPCTQTLTYLPLPRYIRDVTKTKCQVYI